MQDFLVCILSNILVASAMACGILLLGKIWRNPAIAYALWLLVLIKLITPPINTFPCLPNVTIANQQTRTLPVEEPKSPLPAPRLFEKDHAQPSNSDTLKTPKLTSKSTLPKTQIRKNESLNTRQIANKEHTVVDPRPTSIEKTEREFPIRPDVNESRLASTQVFLNSAKVSKALESNDPFPHWQTWTIPFLMFVWILGSLLAISKDILGWVRFQRIVQTSISRPGMVPEFIESEVKIVAKMLGFTKLPRLMVVDSIMSPMIWPTLQGPILILPKSLLANLTPAQFRALAAHELAHLKSLHHWFRWFERGVKSLYWWLPLTRVISFQIRQCEEEVCDAWVVQSMPENAESYAHLLIDTAAFLEEAPDQPHATALGLEMNHFDSLKRRITMVMQQKTKPQISFQGWTALLVFLAVTIPFTPTLANQKPIPVDSAGNSNNAPENSENQEGETDTESAAESDIAANNDDLNFDGIVSTQMSMVAMELDFLQMALGVDMDVMQISFDMEDTISKTTQKMFDRFPSGAGNQMLGISLESSLLQELWTMAENRFGDKEELPSYLAEVKEFHQREDQLGQDFFLSFLSAHLSLSASQEREIRKQIEKNWNTCLNLIFFHPDHQNCAQLTHDLLHRQEVKSVLSPEQWEAYEQLTQLTFSQKQFIDLVLDPTPAKTKNLRWTSAKILQLKIDELRNTYNLSEKQIDQLKSSIAPATQELSDDWQQRSTKYRHVNDSWELERQFSPEERETTFVPLARQLEGLKSWKNAMATTLTPEQKVKVSARASEVRRRENKQFTEMYLYFLNQSRTLTLKQISIVRDVIDSKTYVGFGTCTNLNRIHALILSLPQDEWERSIPVDRSSIDGPIIQQWISEIQDRQPDE